MKVYLSKSNLSDPYLVDRVRDSLLTGGYTVHEHHGGNIYNPNHMLECQAMIMVPSKTAISVESRTLNTKGLGGIYGVHLGKGQMMQFLDFQRHIKTIYSGIKRVPIFVVEEVGDSNIYVSYYHDYELENNPDWKVRFGLVYLEGNCDNMINTLNTAKAAWEIAYPEVTNLVKVPVYDSSQGYTKIVKQEDAIVRFKTNGETYQLQESGGYRSKNIPEMDPLSLNHCLSNLLMEIISVRRFSDGRIFSIDDCTNKGKITGFEIHGDLIKVRVSQFELYNLANLQHADDGITVPPFHTYDPKRGVYPTPGYEKEREALAKKKIAGADAMVDKADYVLKIEKSQPIHLACRRLFNR